MISEYASAMGLWRLLNCLIQKLESLSGQGDFQLPTLIMLTLSSSTLRTFHSIWLICCSSSSRSLIHGASSLCLTSCCSMFCQNFFTSPMSGGYSVWMVFFPSSLPNILASSLNILFCFYCSLLLVYLLSLCVWLVVSALDPLCRL